MPNSIKEAAKITFLRTDSQPDNAIEFKELADYIETNEHAMKIFQKFEAPKKVNEIQMVFSPFPKVQAKDFDILMKECIHTNYKDLKTHTTPEEIYERILHISHMDSGDEQELGSYVSGNDDVSPGGGVYQSELGDDGPEPVKSLGAAKGVTFSRHNQSLPTLCKSGAGARQPQVKKKVMRSSYMDSGSM
jgi:hypothetical protein